MEVPGGFLRGGTVKELCELKGRGHSIRGIARELAVSRSAVRKYLKSPEVFKEKPRRRRVSKMDPYTDHINGRLPEGLFLGFQASSVSSTTDETPATFWRLARARSCFRHEGRGPSARSVHSQSP